MVEVIRELALRAGSLVNIAYKTLPTQVFAKGIQALVQRRLDRMPDWGRPLLEIAALLGRQLDLTVLAQVPEAPHLQTWLHAGLAAAIIEADGEGWRFAHDKLREATLATLPDTLRPQRVLAAARSLEGCYAENPAYTVPLLHLWQQVGEVERVVHYASRAVAYYNRRGQFAEAKAIGLGGLTTLPPTLAAAHLLWNAGRAYAHSTEPTHSLPYSQRAHDLASALGDVHLATLALQDIGTAHFYLGEFDQAKAVGERLQAVLTQLTDVAVRVEVYGLFLNPVYRHLGDLAATQRFREATLAELPHCSDFTLRAQVLVNIAVGDVEAGRLEAAAANYEESIRLARHQQDLRTLVYALGGLIHVQTVRHDLADAQAAGEEMLTLAHRLGDHYVHILGMCHLARAYFHDRPHTDHARVQDLLYGAFRMAQVYDLGLSFSSIIAMWVYYQLPTAPPQQLATWWGLVQQTAPTVLDHAVNEVDDHLQAALGAEAYAAALTEGAPLDIQQVVDTILSNRGSTR